MAGDSAGGGLTIALMMYQRDEGLSTPSKALLLSVSFFLLLTHSPFGPLSELPRERGAEDEVDICQAQCKKKH